MNKYSVLMAVAAFAALVVGFSNSAAVEFFEAARISSPVLLVGAALYIGGRTFSFSAVSFAGLIVTGLAYVVIPLDMVVVF